MTLVGRTLGRYRLEELLGQGGMAEVYEATDTKLGRTVAVKVILATHARQAHFASRFMQEAQLIAKLEHPSILPVYDFGDEEGLPFLVMPYLEGGSLRERMAGRPVAFPQAVAWVRQLADALDAAHAAGVLHRDVKPANVLLGKDDRLFLADFGIAKLLDQTTGLTATGTVVGTPIYMAPEQAQGRPSTPASDRYALAVIAWELLTGHPPFEAETPLALMNQHVTAPVPVLSARIAGLPNGLDTVFERALAKRPEERPPTCRAFADQLLGFLPSGTRAAVELPTTPWVPAFGTSAATRIEATPKHLARAAPRSQLTSEPTVSTSPQQGTRRSALLAAALGGGAVALVAVGILVRPALLRPDPKPAATSPAVGTPSVPPAAPPATAGLEPTAAPSPRDRVEVVELPAPPGPPPPAPPVAKGRNEAVAAGGTAMPRPAGVDATREAERAAVAADSLAGRDPQELKARFEPVLLGLRRATRADFDDAAAGVRALPSDRIRPGTLAIGALAEGGLAYLDGRDAEAGRKLLEASAFARSSPGGPRDIQNALPFRIAANWTSERGSEPPAGWALALAYGDARREAAGLLEESLRRRPDDARALLGRAVLARMEGQLARAIEDATKAWHAVDRTDPLASSAAFLLSDLEREAGRPREAAEWLSRALGTQRPGPLGRRPRPAAGPSGGP